MSDNDVAQVPDPVTRAKNAYLEMLRTERDRLVKKAEDFRRLINLVERDGQDWLEFVPGPITVSHSGPAQPVLERCTALDGEEGIQCDGMKSHEGQHYSGTRSWDRFPRRVVPPTLKERGHGVTGKKLLETNPDVVKARALWDQRPMLSGEEIGAAVGKSGAAIYLWKKHFNWPDRGALAQGKRAKPVAETVAAPDPLPVVPPRPPELPAAVAPNRTPRPKPAAKHRSVAPSIASDPRFKPLLKPVQCPNCQANTDRDPCWRCHQALPTSLARYK